MTSSEVIDEGDGPRYHRKWGPTQTDADAVRQVASGELWGRPARGSNIPKVKAWAGLLPGGRAGVEFTTDLTPDHDSIPWLPTWSSRRSDVRLEDGFAKIRITVTVHRLHAVAEEAHED